MTARVELSKRAQHDLDRLDQPTARRLMTAVERLKLDQPPANLDVKPLEAHAPWRRLRVGKYRVIFRALTGEESRERAAGSTGYVIERVIDRRDLDEAVKRL